MRLFQWFTQGYGDLDAVGVADRSLPSPAEAHFEDADRGAT